ncbi:hypothetical protein QE152_g15894 [Popillia japonica]|uniref:Uncharacterized protein n=1 Tax=Popillia japonica TaxID=7064 RepID=A0AAW1L6Q0_POPJA
MGASLCCVEKFTIDKRLLNECEIKYDEVVQELLSVQNRLDDLQEVLKVKDSQLESYKRDNQSVNQRIQFSKNRYKSLEKQLEKYQSSNIQLKNELKLLQEDNLILKKTNADVKKLQSILAKTKEEFAYVKLENKNLQTQNINSKSRLAQVNADLEIVSETLKSERAQNEKHNQRWQMKYQSLMESRDEYMQNPNETKEELTNLNQHNAILELANLRLKTELKQLEDKKENDDIKKLQTSNTDLKSKLEQLNKDNDELKQDIYEITGVHNDTVLTLKNDLDEYRQNLEDSNKKLAKETVTDPTLRKIIQIYRQIEEMQPVISTKTDFIVKQIKENDHGQHKVIEKLKSDYDNYEGILLAKNITINRTNFIDNYAKYKHLSQRNNDNKKDVLKRVYQIAKTLKNFQEKYNTFSEELYKNVGKIEKSLTDLDIKLLIQGLTEEKVLSQDVLKIAKEEIIFRQKFLQIEVEASETNDCNILNIGKPDDISGADANNTKESEKKSYGVVLFGAPYTNQSDSEDRVMISTFLVKNGLDDQFFKNRRFKKDKNGKRALVIEFTNEDIVDKIIELGQQKNWFLGFNPAVKVYIDNK